MLPKSQIGPTVEQRPENKCAIIQFWCGTCTVSGLPMLGHVGLQIVTYRTLS